MPKTAYSGEMRGKNMIKTGKKDYENGYTPHSWKGINYDRDLTTKDISKLVRKELKALYPDCKFSITTDYNQINVCLMSADNTPFEIDNNIDYNLLACRDNWRNAEQLQNDFESIRRESYLQVNHFHIKTASLLNEKSKELFTMIKDILDSFNFNDSDCYTDYFHSNFYVNLAVGKWDKRFTINAK